MKKRFLCSIKVGPYSTLCMLGNFSLFFLYLQIFFYVFSKYFFRTTNLSDCQMVWIKIRPDVVSKNKIYSKNELVREALLQHF